MYICSSPKTAHWLRSKLIACQIVRPPCKRQPRDQTNNIVI